jgi:hypothetical protein
MGFGAFLGQGGKKLERTKKNKKNKKFRPMKGSEEKLDR